MANMHGMTLDHSLFTMPDRKCYFSNRLWKSNSKTGKSIWQNDLCIKSPGNWNLFKASKYIWNKLCNRWSHITQILYTTNNWLGIELARSVTLIKSGKWNQHIKRDALGRQLSKNSQGWSNHHQSKRDHFEKKMCKLSRPGPSVTFLPLRNKN